jgi:hypothetical protein
LLRTIFRRARDARDAAGYLQSVLSLLLQRADAELTEEGEEKTAEPVFSAVEREFLACYAQAVDRLAELIGQYDYKFRVTTFFHLLQRLTQGEMVPFSGEPLAGLQLMGVLETRSVDFDNVIILSMNEGVFPAKAVSNTFIPMSLRSAFGMPTQKHRDAVFAYHFYRLCSRARRVTYIYDTRSGGTQTGEVSRYLLQLRHVYGLPMEERPVHYEIGVGHPQPIVVYKDERIQQRLARYLEGGKKALSASALKSYCACPLKFYLTYVEDLREDDEVTEGIDGSQFGSVFHDAMSRLFAPMCGRMVTADYLKSLIEHPTEIPRVIGEAFKEVMNVDRVEGYLGLVSEIIREFILQVLRHDVSVAPFTYIASEYQQNIAYQAGELKVRLTCIYDRIDIDRQGRIRIIDYKTSAPKVGMTRKTQFNSVAGLFSPDSKTCSDEAMQVMLYCALLRRAGDEDLRRMGLLGEHDPLLHPVTPHLYSVRDFYNENISTVLIFKPGRTTPEEEASLPAGPLTEYGPFAERFEGELNRVLGEIFDVQRPFAQCEDMQACSFCPFKTICARI